MLLKNALVINPADKFENRADIRIKDDIITGFAPSLNPEPSEEVIDLKGKIITPGLVDMHCHLREPGFTAKETIKTGIDAAIEGGFTAVCPMANTNPPVDNAAILTYTIKQAADRIGFYPICAVTKELKGEKLVNVSELINSGAAAFSDDGRPIENMRLLREAVKYINSHNKIIILHSEDLDLASNGVMNEGRRSALRGLKGIPDTAESAAIARELEIIRSVNGRCHFAHVSAKRSVELIRQAKKEGLNVTSETAPHYFSLTEDDIIDYDARYKVNPPLRAKEDLEAVIEGLKDGTIDVIASDHAPHTLSEKQMPVQAAPMGISGFETELGLTLTNLVHTGNLELIDAVSKLSYNPARILGLKNQGIIKIGVKANLTIIDLNEEWTVNAQKFKSKCRISPFDGFKLKGRAKMTVINGKIHNIGI